MYLAIAKHLIYKTTFTCNIQQYLYTMLFFPSWKMYFLCELMIVQWGT